MSFSWKDKDFFKAMFAIALPITLQNLITSSVNMLDTLMITSLGEASLAAVGLANQMFFFYSVTVFGIATGSAIFIAQFWGKGDKTNIKKVLGLSLFLVSIMGFIFTLVALLIPDKIMRIFSNDIEVISLGVKYISIIAFTYIITGISFAYGIASRSIGQAKMPMVTSIISFVTNALFNYILIFGKLGFPKLGIRGAAYGTLIARALELALILYAIYATKSPLAGRFKEYIDWDMAFIKTYFKTTLPVVINEALWALGTVMYSLAYARIGTEAAASVQILNTVQNLFMVLTRGLGNACTVMVGNKIGAGEEDLAVQYANKYLVISTGLGLILGISLYLGSDFILSIFRNLNPALYATSKKLLIVLALFFFIKSFNGTMIVGVFRGGGDTRFSMMVEMFAVWFIGVPLAFLGALVFKLPVYYVAALVYIEEIVKAAIGIPRIISKKWVKNIVEDM